MKVKPEHKYFKNNAQVVKKTANVKQEEGAGQKVGAPVKVEIKDEKE